MANQRQQDKEAAIRIFKRNYQAFRKKREPLSDEMKFARYILAEFEDQAKRITKLETAISQRNAKPAARSPKRKLARKA